MQPPSGEFPEQTPADFAHPIWRRREGAAGRLLTFSKPARSPFTEFA
jgi:hypothetical protein